MVSTFSAKPTMTVAVGVKAGVEKHNAGDVTRSAPAAPKKRPADRRAPEAERSSGDAYFLTNSAVMLAPTLPIVSKPSIQRRAITTVRQVWFPGMLAPLPRTRRAVVSCRSVLRLAAFSSAPALGSAERSATPRAAGSPAAFRPSLGPRRSVSRRSAWSLRASRYSSSSKPRATEPVFSPTSPACAARMIVCGSLLV